MIETIFDTLNCKAAIIAVENYLEKNISALYQQINEPKDTNRYKSLNS